MAARLAVLLLSALALAEVRLTASALAAAKRRVLRLAVPGAYKATARVLAPALSAPSPWTLTPPPLVYATPRSCAPHFPAAWK
jgi:hypothetical protein